MILSSLSCRGVRDILPDSKSFTILQEKAREITLCVIIEGWVTTYAKIFICDVNVRKCIYHIYQAFYVSARQVVYSVGIKREH